MTDITPVVEAVVALCVALVTVFVIPWIKSNVSAKKLDEISKWVEFAVAAAEQLADSGQINKSDKFQYVVDFLAGKGYQVNMNEIRVLIESYVNKLPQALEVITAETVSSEKE